MSAVQGDVPLVFLGYAREDKIHLKKLDKSLAAFSYSRPSHRISRLYPFHQSRSFFLRGLSIAFCPARMR